MGNHPGSTLHRHPHKSELQLGRQGDQHIKYPSNFEGMGSLWCNSLETASQRSIETIQLVSLTDTALVFASTTHRLTTS